MIRYLVYIIQFVLGRDGACWHPKAHVYFNEFNGVVQCHRCGQVMR